MVDVMGSSYGRSRECLVKSWDAKIPQYLTGFVLGMHGVVARAGKSDSLAWRPRGC